MYSKLALGNVRRSFRDYAIYFLTLVFGVCVFYAFNSMSQQSTVLNLTEAQGQMMELLSVLIGGVSVFLAVVLGFLIVYANRYLIRRRKQEFGTYLLLGMDKGKVSLIIVLEALFVGVVSLAVGLLFGVALSQGLLFVTAALFDVTVTTFAFTFSVGAGIQTVIYFGIMFLVALLFNVTAVSRYKLIDLINANRVNETIKLRNLALSLILFVVSLAMIATAYYLLLQNGLTQISAEFWISTALVCAGTVLFFFSLSGLLLRVIQASKKLYYSGLNMFTLRQLSSKINTAFVSLSIVSIALFLTLTSTCGGLSIGTTLNNNLETTTPYDASFVSFYETAGALDGTAPAETAPSAHEKAAAADDYDMHAALSRDIPQYDDLVKQDAQIDFYYGPVKFGQMMATTKYDFGSSYDLATLQERPVSLVSLSQYNAIRALVGAEPVELADDECLLWCDFSTVQSFFEAFLKQNDTLDVDGTPMRLSSEGLQTFASQTSSFALNAGTLILPDAAMPADKVRADSCLNVMYTGSREETSAPFVAAVDAAYGSGSSASSSQDRWPFNGLMTAQQAYIQSVGTSTIIAYLAIYIGFVLLIACAAILALQQLTEASDNVSRYRLLEEIGAEQHMVNKALFIQIGIYFIFPMIVAICHSVVALLVVADVVEVFGGIQILQPLLVTVTLFIAVYGGYFLVTYFASRALIRPRLRSR